MVFILSGTVYADDCGNRKIGVVGASNTVKPSFVDKLEALCPDSTFVVKAKSGTSPAFGHEFQPPSQLELLQQLPLENLDMVIISPSGNTCNNPGLIDKQIDALQDMVEIAKQRGVKEIVVLTISPRKTGQLPCVQDFNQELITTRFGIQNIDHVINIYPILDDPNDPGRCAYCKNDGVHFTSVGHERVALTIFYNVFKGTSPPSLPEESGTTKGTPSATTEPTAPPATTPLISQNCNNQQRCKEIDEAWLKLGLKGNQVWVPGKGWYDKAQVYATTTSGLTTTSGKEISVTTIKGKEFTVAGQKGECRAQFGTPERRALLDTISWAEGAGDYNIMFGGKVQQDLSQHPIYTGEMPPQGFPFGTSSSTAAGRYQFLKSTYDDLTQNGYFSTGFWPPEQDQAALYLAYQKRGLTDAQLSSAIQMGNFVPVWDQLAREWASLPYSKEDCSSNSCTADCKHKTKGTQCGFGKSYYGQGGRALSSLQEVFTTCLQYHNQI